MSHRAKISRIAVLSLAVMLISLLPAMAQDGAASTEPAGRGTIEAKIQIRGQGGSPEGTVLTAYHIDSKQVFRSEPAKQKGTVTIIGIPYGYFDLAVELDGKLYVASQVVVVPPSGKVVVSLALEPYEDDRTGTVRSFQGSDSPVEGVARLSRKAVGKEFWRGPAGIAIITGISGAGLLAIASGSDPAPVSPTIP